MIDRPPHADGRVGGTRGGARPRRRVARVKPGGLRLLPGFLVAFGWLLAAAPAGAVVPAVRRILVVDSDAEVFNTNDRRGAVFILGYDFPELRIATTGKGLVDPVAVAPAPDRLLYVLDASADPLGLGTSYGAVWRADPSASATAAPRLVGASALFRALADILVDSETGDLFVSDRESDPAGWGRQNGCVYRIDPRTNSVSIVAAPSVFSEPLGLAWDLDGSLLVVDRTANPQQLLDPAGALFRVNPRTGSVALVRALARSSGFVRPAAVAVIDHGPHRGDYLLADSDADPFDLGDKPGAVYRLPADGSPPEFFCAATGFQEPIDVLLGVREDVLVLDRLAVTAGNPLGVGAVFRFRLSDGSVMQSPWGSNSFRSLSGFFQLAGAEVDSSTVLWTDENRGQTSPGDVFSVRARIVNTGTIDAASVTLSDTLRSPFTYVAGSDSFGTGQGAYDPAVSAYRWEGSLARGDSTTVRFRIRLSDGAQGRFTQGLTLRADGTPATFLRPIIPFRDFVSGVVAFADFVPIQGTDTGFLYLVGADSLSPAVLWQDRLLRRPSDLVFLEDGRLAMLDTASPAGELGAVLVYSAASSDTVALLRALRLEDGLRSPAGLALDRDGTLLLVDRNANPNGWPYTPDPRIGDSGPGAVYRLDPLTKELGLVAAPDAWREPIDAAVDRNGRIVVVDYEGGGEKQGSLWELGPEPGFSREIPLDARLFRDPASVACDPLNDLYICDPSFGGGGNPNGGAVLKMRRGNPIGYSIATSNPMLRRPVDCAVAPDGRVYIADRDANPHDLPGADHGAVFVWNPANGRLEVAAATAFLRQPDGVACVGTGDLFASRLNLVTPGGGDPRPGDTLRVDVRLINRGLSSVPQGIATLALSPTLLAVAETPAPEGVAYDRVNNLVSWTGRVAFGDTVAYSARVAVLPGASYGTPAEVRLTIEGARVPVQLRASRPIRSAFTPNDILLVDSAANPTGLPDSVGALFRLGPEAGDPVSVVYSSLSLRNPSAMEWNGLGELILAASRGADPGHIYRFNTASGGLSLLTTPADSALRSPSDLLLSRQGDLFIVDPDALGPVPEARGAVFRKPLSLSPLSVFSRDARFRSPRQIAYGPDGRLYLADPDADPEQLGGNPGAVFILSESTGEVVDWLQNPNLMPDPVGVAPFDDSTLVITDPRGGSGVGTLLLYRPFRDLLFPLVQLNEFRSIWRTSRLPSGELLVLDRGGVQPDQTGGVGVVHGFDPVLRRLRTYAWSDSFRHVSDLVPKPGPVVRISRYEAEDLNGPPLHPADRVRIHAHLRNIGTSVAATVSYTDTMPPGLSLVEESAFATSGRIQADRRGVTWTGGILAADSVRINYEVQLNPALVEGRVLTLVGRVREPAIGTLTRRLDLETHVPLEPGHLYLLDSDANPYAQVGHTGALFKVDLVTGSVVPMFVPAEFRKPVSIALVGNQAAPKFLILDTFARNQLGRVNTLFLFDPATREMRNLGGHSTWLAPSKVLAWTDEDALLLDSGADPFDLIPGNSSGPGALYRVELESGGITPIFSDTTLKFPTGLAWWSEGVLAISDIKADPAGYGNENGAIYTLDLAAGDLTFLASSPIWRTPRAIASRPGGGLLVADRDATPYDAGGGVGSVHAVGTTGQAVLLTVSPLFAYLNDVQSEVNGNPIVADGNTDPYRFGVRPGAILRWRSAVNGRFLPLTSSPLFREPESFVIFGGLVPVVVAEASARTTPEGIELTWRGSDDATGARYLVYRRAAEGPDDPGDADPSRSELASGETEFLGPGPHRFLDRDVEPGRWYAYLIAGIDTDGSVTYATPLLARAPEGVARLELARPSPNPFRPGRALRFAVPAPGGHVRLTVHDVTGRRVRRLVDGPVSPGRHAVTWDGRDDAGMRVAAGVYFVRLSRGDEARRVRLVLLR